MSDEIDMLCEECGQTFSAFLHEMADKNERVVCPNCRAGRDCNSPKATEPVAGARPVRRISLALISHCLARCAFPSSVDSGDAAFLLPSCPLWGRHRQTPISGA